MCLASDNSQQVLANDSELQVSTLQLSDNNIQLLGINNNVGLSNILDSEVMQDIRRRKPMERPHRKGVAVSLVGS